MGTGQDRQHDAEAGAERHRPGDGVQPGGPDALAGTLPGGHPPGAGLDDLPGGRDGAAG
jgi:hypothetical protein